MVPTRFVMEIDPQLAAPPFNSTTFMPLIVGLTNIIYRVCMPSPNILSSRLCIFQSQISPSDPSTQRWLRSDLLRIHAAQGACSGRLPESHLMCSLLAGIGWHEIGS